VSGGRVSYVIGLGYRPEEYAMFGVEMATRGKVMDQKLDALRRALAGERFVYEGRPVHVTPSPLTPGGPRLMYGGHSVAAARRAGRLGLDLFAEGGPESLREAYHAAAAEAGVTPGNVHIPTRDMGTSVFVAEDVDAAWGELGQHLLHDATTYDEWMAPGVPSASRSAAATVEQLRAERGAYRVLSVEEAAAQVRAGAPLSMQPLCGGVPPEVAWKSVQLAGTAVQQRLTVSEGG
jgi:alkanesulfonate monooxygenase SsuD/methylene tetrahydromethanopterin reductase-like flavin-dependent oxidoreductase (luciferase family)